MIFLLTAFLVAFLLDFLFGDPAFRMHPSHWRGDWPPLLKESAGSCWAAAFFPVWRDGFCWLPYAVWRLTSQHGAGWRLNVWCGAVLAGAWLYVCIALRSLIDHAEAIRRL